MSVEELDGFFAVSSYFDDFFGVGPGRFRLNDSISERFNSVFPPMSRVVKRPFATKRAMACRVTPRSIAASVCETH